MFWKIAPSHCRVVGCPAVLLLGMIMTLVYSIPVPSLRAEEPASEFLSGLRSRGFHDVAIDYLDQMASSRLAPTEWKELIPFEKAITLVAASRSQRDPEMQTQLLDRAQFTLQQFIDVNVSHPKANAARNQLGSLIFERARVQVQIANRDNSQEGLKQARTRYEQAFQVFGELSQRISNELDAIPKVLDTRDRTQAKLIAKRKQLRADNLQTELLAAAVREEMAETVPSGSDTWTEDLSTAAQLYESIYKNYRGRLAGYYARMYQGRCNQRMGKLKDALGHYRELLEQPNESEGMFNLKTETLQLAMDCWLIPSQNKFLECIRRGEPWMALAPANQLRDPVWLSIRLNLARAYKIQAEVAGQLDPPDTLTVRRSNFEALQHAKFVASESGDLQETAQELVASLGGTNDDQADPLPQDFAAAAVLAKEALDQIGPAQQALQTANARLASAGANSDQAKAELAEASAAVNRAIDQAVEAYRYALNLADEQTPKADVNLARYFLCYLYYLGGDYFESALVGDFVSKRFPDSAGALQCAKISLACYLTLFEQAGESADRTFEIARMVSVAQHVSSTWPTSNEAENSLSTLVPHLVNAGALEEAKDLTLRIAETSPARGTAELTTGQAYWGASLRLAKQIRDQEADDSVDAETLTAQQVDLEQLQLTAKSLLTAGFERLPEPQEESESPVNVETPTVTALLSLARAHMQFDDDELALKVLQHPLAGPLTLVDAGNEAINQSLLIEETYRVALHSTIGLLDEDPAMVDQAMRLITALRDTIGTDSAGQQRLQADYANLARRMQTLLETSPPESRQELSTVFEAFLQQLSSGATDSGVLNWVAETLAGIGDGLQADQTTPNPESNKYYQQSIQAFQNLLVGGELSESLRVQVQARLAAVMAKAGNYSESLAILEQVLAANPNAVNVQIEAARVLGQWGRQEPAKYELAIAGIDPGGSTSHVWGWGKIASATLSHQQFRDEFFLARYEIASCRFALAGTKTGDQAKQLLRETRNDLTKLQQLYPSLGGGQRKQEFEDLLNRVYAALGETPPQKIDLANPPQN